MPKYFYTITHDEETAPDLDGVELASDQEAWEQAVIACAEVIKDADGDLRPRTQWRLDVHAEDRAPLFTLRLVTEDHRG